MEIRLEIISCFVGHLAHRTGLLQSAMHSLNASSDNVGSIHECFLYTHLHVVSFSSQLQHQWSLKAPLHWFLLAENLVKILQSYQTNKPWEYEWKTNNKNNVHKMPRGINVECLNRWNTINLMLNLQSTGMKLKKQCTFKFPSAVILSLLQLPQKCSLMEVINPNWPAKPGTLYAWAKHTQRRIILTAGYIEK